MKNILITLVTFFGFLFIIGLTLSFLKSSGGSGSRDNGASSETQSNSDSEEQIDQHTTIKTDVDICKCLTEPGNSEYMTQNGKACDEAISKEIGVADWGKVNMKYDKVTSKKFDELAYKCTGKRHNVEISGTYSGTDNVGMELSPR